MSGVTLASRAFNQDDQIFFARLSGDFNPIHMDPLAARRTQAGAPVVHGIHAVLWALDKLAENGMVTGEVSGVKVQFIKFIYVASTVMLNLRHRDEKSIKVELVVGGLTTTILTLTFGTSKQTCEIALPGVLERVVEREPAILIDLKEAAAQSGWMDVNRALTKSEGQFPHADSAIGARRVAAIAVLSTLTGMVCPGMYSLFAAFAIDLVENSNHKDAVGFSVSETDERFRMIRMNVSGAGIRGSVQAFLRWPPIGQASFDEVSKVVAPAEFAGSTVLIVGGSRGLGALTAKVVAAGGGKVIVTYATGRKDAEKLAEEICGHTTHDACRVIQYDVRQDAASQLKLLETEVSHLYYFATTSIFRQKDGFFVSSLLDEFIEIYVKGFYDCCRVLNKNSSQALIAYYPSTVAIDNNPLSIIEYTMAKMAGEILCANMNRANTRTRVVVSRLPRLMTDQTATVAPATAAEPFEALLPVIRQVQSLGSAVL